MDENSSISNTENNEGGSSKWAWVVAVAVIAALVAFYVWPKKEAAPAANTAAEEIDVSTRSLENIGASDEVADIEKDLNETNLSDLDKEIGDLESEIGPQ